MFGFGALYCDNPNPSSPIIRPPAMRLLTTSFTKNRGDPPKLEEFFGSGIPPYAILSHTWGREEVTFQDLASSTEPPYHHAGFAKLRGCCARAGRDGYKYVWIDTCWYVPNSATKK